MKKFLAILSLLICASAVAQPTLVPGSASNTSIAGRDVRISLPADTSRKLRLVFATAGAGVNSYAALAGQAPSNKWSEAGGWAVVRDSFVVIHVKRETTENSGTMDFSEIDAVLDYVFSGSMTFINTTDANYNSWMGLSQGNQEMFKYLSDRGPVFESYTPHHREKFSREVSLSTGATEFATDNRGPSAYKPSGTWVWYGADDATTGTFYPDYLYDVMLPINPAPRTKVTLLPSPAAHDASVWDSACSKSGTNADNSVWAWLLSYSYGLSNTSPIANAGSTQIVNLGGTTATLNGSGSLDPDGSIASYAWTQISGAASTIVSASSASTNITGLATGYYRYRLLVTDNQGATDDDTVSVVVTGINRHPIPKRTDNVFRKGSLTSVFPVTRLVDGATDTTINPSTFSSPIVDYPTTLVYMLDSNYNNITARIYNGSGAGTVYPVRFYNHARTSSTTINFSTVANGWNYLDSNRTKGIAHDVRWIEIDLPYSTINLAEMDLNGYTLGVASAVFRDSLSPIPSTMQEFYAAANNGDEPDSLMSGIAGTVRTFHNFSYYDTAASYNASARSFINSFFGGDPNAILERRRDSGFIIQYAMYGCIRAFIDPVPSSPLTFNAINTDNFKNRVAGQDSTLPETWRPSAQWSYHLSVWAGRNASANYNPAHTWKKAGGVDITEKAMDYVDVYEEGNESNAPWSGTRYQNSQVRAAKQSAVYDGHKGTMGNYVGAKAADPTMKVSIGALVSGDTVLIKSDALYNYFYRGYDSMAFDVYTINQYFTPTGEQSAVTPSPNGVSPAQFNFYNKALKWVSLRNRYFPGRRIGLGEFGWDKNQNSAYAALAHGTITGEVAQANFIVQALLMGRAAGLDRMAIYRTRDEGDTTQAGDFVTSGLFNASTGMRWASNYWVTTNYAMTKRYNNSLPTVEANGDSTGYWRMKFSNSSPTDTITVVVFHGGVNDVRSSYQVTVGSTTWCEVVKMQKGKLLGDRTTVTPSSGIVTIANAGEEPVYVRYIAQTVTPELYKFKVPSSRRRVKF